jgi:hypothetical protein
MDKTRAIHRRKIDLDEIILAPENVTFGLKLPTLGPVETNVWYESDSEADWEYQVVVTGEAITDGWKLRGTAVVMGEIVFHLIGRPYQGTK